MLDRLLGKKEKGIQVFNIPEKRYCHDRKKISKMDKKDLIDVMADMEKHIGSLCEKVAIIVFSWISARSSTNYCKRSATKLYKNQTWSMQK